MQGEKLRWATLQTEKDIPARLRVSTTIGRFVWTSPRHEDLGPHSDSADIACANHRIASGQTKLGHKFCIPTFPGENLRFLLFSCFSQKNYENAAELVEFWAVR